MNSSQILKALNQVETETGSSVPGTNTLSTDDHASLQDELEQKRALLNLLKAKKYIPVLPESRISYDFSIKPENVQHLSPRSGVARGGEIYRAILTCGKAIDFVNPNTYYARRSSWFGATGNVYERDTIDHHALTAQRYRRNGEIRQGQLGSELLELASNQTCRRRLTSRLKYHEKTLYVWVDEKNPTQLFESYVDPQLLLEPTYEKGYIKTGTYVNKDGTHVRLSLEIHQTNEKKRKRKSSHAKIEFENENFNQELQPTIEFTPGYYTSNEINVPTFNSNTMNSNTMWPPIAANANNFLYNYNAANITTESLDPNTKKSAIPTYSLQVLENELFHSTDALQTLANALFNSTDSLKNSNDGTLTLQSTTPVDPCASKFEELENELLRSTDSLNSSNHPSRIFTHQQQFLPNANSDIFEENYEKIKAFSQNPGGY